MRKIFLVDNATDEVARRTVKGEAVRANIERKKSRPGSCSNFENCDMTLYYGRQAKKQVCRQLSLITHQKRLVTSDHDHHHRHPTFVIVNGNKMSQLGAPFPATSPVAPFLCASKKANEDSVALTSERVKERQTYSDKFPALMRTLACEASTFGWTVTIKI